MTTVFHWSQGIVAGAGGVIAMSMLMRMGIAMGMTTMDLPTVLGSMFRGDRPGARLLGTMLHLMNGLAFGLVYADAAVAHGNRVAVERVRKPLPGRSAA